MSAKSQPIIVIKRKGAHAGHHGGAWKVAYADFVTAMMSLFIVLWLMNSSEKIKKAVAGYFNDPKGTASLMGTTMTGTGETVSAAAANDLQKLKEKLEDEIKAKKDLLKLSKQIEITITPEGLRIELLEDKKGTFYQSGSAQLSSSGQELLSLLAGELKTLPNSLLIEGHTDAAPYSANAAYTNWELSADRANAARRLMQQDGVRRDQVTQVRGYADQLLRVKANPYDPSNRRVTILVKNQQKVPSTVKTADAGLNKPYMPETKKHGTREQSSAPTSMPETTSVNAATEQSRNAGERGWMSRLKRLIPGSGR